jgi:hypothetical protein
MKIVKEDERLAWPRFTLIMDVEYCVSPKITNHKSNQNGADGTKSQPSLDNLTQLNIFMQLQGTAEKT